MAANKSTHCRFGINKDALIVSLARHVNDNCIRDDYCFREDIEKSKKEKSCV